MTIHEASERYNIPIAILKEYEGWNLCGTVKKVMGAWQYDDRDIERLSMIMTLHDIGFTGDEVETYCACCWMGNPPRPSGCGCWARNAAAPWMRSTSRNGNWSGWIICGMR